jgi:hypothetical protein
MATAAGFDVVLFMGVLHHLRHPLLALDLVAEHLGDAIVGLAAHAPPQKFDEPFRPACATPARR